MYGMIPFGRMNTSWNDLFDDFERRMFPADRSELPAFRTDIRDEGDHFLLEADLPGAPGRGICPLFSPHAPPGVWL